MSEAPYDPIAKEYQESKLLPFRKHLEEYTLFKLLGDLRGKTVLDLACGEGIYARKMKEQGASSVIGMDLSSEMIALARQREAECKLGISYEIGDASSGLKIGDFDIVLGSYLLNYANSPEHLLQFCQTIAVNLKPGGRFVGVNDNPANDPADYGSYRPYGFIKTTAKARIEGAPVTYVMFNPDGKTFSFDNYYLSPDTYAWAFRTAGLASLAFTPLALSPAGLSTFGKEYWQLFLNKPPIIALEALRV
ncbi:MAG: class I SAM-dependent methyltransferase [Proteobacteria bacterium]|nr:class I SAM-dependent methyltransferase [Pseudomonadota bacterium]